MVTDELAQVLGLTILQCGGSFKLVDISLGKYARNLGPTRLQFHDMLELKVENIRVPESDSMSCIIGTDLLGESSYHLCTTGTHRDDVVSL